MKISKKLWIKRALCMVTALAILLPQAQPLQATAKIKGFDVSAYNGVIDWETVAVK